MKTTKKEIEKLAKKEYSYINGDLFKNYLEMPDHAIYKLNMHAGDFIVSEPLKSIVVFIVGA